MPGIYRILILGGGAMGRALYDGWIDTGWPRKSIAIADRVPERCVGGPDGGPPGTTMLLIAVKPQHVGAALHQHVDRLEPGDCIVSIAAGIELARLGEETPSGVHVFRAMPNLPVRNAKGSICLSHPEGVPSAMIEAVAATMSRLGDCILLEEGLIDAFTAMAGSGPAYFYAFTEQLERAGQAAGLPIAVSQRLARQILIGAAGLLEQSAKTPGQLKEMVTSPGGTTEAGLDALNRDNSLATLIDGCLTAAKARSRELSAPDLMEEKFPV